MQHIERVERLRSMLEQVAPNHDLESLSVAEEGKAPRENGEESLSPAAYHRPPNGRTSFGSADANSGLDKLRRHRDRDLSREELLGVEAIVLARDRPAVFVRGGTYDQIGGVWTDLDTRASRERINPLLDAIGRIEVPNMQQIPYAGTGFLVGRDLLMTNRHVARLFAEGLGTRLRYHPGDAGIDFKSEIDSVADRATWFDIEQVLMIHPYWDMALLKVAGLAGRHAPLTLSVRAPEDLLDRSMAAIGYPARDPRNDLELQDRIYGRVYNVKRLQPGKVRPRMRVRSFEHEVDAMVHDSTTLGGCSGAAVIDCLSGRVIGLHFAGEYLKANYAVPSYELARDPRVVDAGVQFDGGLPPADSLNRIWRKTDGAERTASNADAPAPVDVQPAPDGRGLQVPITLRLNIEIEGAGQAGADGANRLDRGESAPNPSTRKISMATLQQMARDPELPESELRRYFIARPEESRAFAPAVIPNPALVDVAEPLDVTEGAMMMSWANGLARLRRQERFKLRRALGDSRPVLVSEGDSWFQFPILLDDVIDQLHDQYTIWSVDAAGDTLQNMVHDRAEYLDALRRHAGSARAFLFSGGGNDIVGDDAQGQSVVARIVRSFEAGQPAEWYVATPEARQKFDWIEASYRKVLAAVEREFPRLPVICHGYGYAIPGGAPGDDRHPGWAAVDKWLGVPLRERLGIRDPELQRAIVRLLIDRFNDMLRRLCGASHPGGVFANAWHVDVRDTVGRRWADELHPTNDGFAAVGQVFDNVLRRALHAREEALAAPDQERTPNLGDDAEALRMFDRAGTEAPYAEAVPVWRTATAIDALRADVNLKAPRRSKTSDGTVGDAAHRTRQSDHNPWVEDGGTGVVTAVDITHSPANGCDCTKLAQSLQAGRDPRIKYVIWNRRIMSSRAIDGAAPWEWRSYHGANPHDKHVHISVHPDKRLYDDMSPWQVSV